jgi:hypothetical protein
MCGRGPSGHTERVSIGTDGTQANRDSTVEAVDRRCRIVGFSTTADTLAPGDTNRNREAFIRDRATGTTTRIQVPDGDTVDVHAGVPSISRDGRHVLVTASRSGTPSYLHYLYEVATGRLTEILRFDPPRASRCGLGWSTAAASWRSSPATPA